MQYMALDRHDLQLLHGILKINSRVMYQGACFQHSGPGLGHFALRVTSVAYVFG